MIRNFAVENFLSIKTRQVLDLEIPRNATDPDDRFARPVESSDKRFPKVVAVFGANASGKTNFLSAISLIESFVLDSIDWRPSDFIPIFSFANEASHKEKISFHVEFDAGLNLEEGKKPPNNKTVFQYYLEISSDRTKIERETLKYLPHGRWRLLFDRLGDDIKAGSDFGLPKRDPVRTKVRPDASVISTLARFNHTFSVLISNHFSIYQSNIFLAHDVKFGKDTATEIYKTQPVIFQQLNNIIRRFDIGIKRVLLVDREEGIEPVFEHDGLDRSISFSFESQGTQQFYKSFPAIFVTLSLGGVAILDELDNDIHPLILLEIVRLFENSETNPFNAQLIMSCHNATLLEHLVKEEVYFTEKNSQGETEIYGLKDIQGVRRDTNIYAKYLAGAFGGIPRVA